MVSFKTGPTQKGSPMREKFKQLVGADYLRDGELEKPSDAPDPRHHALAYYQWVLDMTTDELHDMWHESRKLVAKIRSAWPNEHELDDMEIQGLQTIVWGYKLMRQFAREQDIEPDNVFDRDDLRRGLRHVVSEIGPDGQRKSHMDRWLELVERATAMDYLEPGTHWDVVHEGQPSEELRLNGSQTFDAISKYIRDHGLDDADVLSNWADYKKRFAEAEENPDSYVECVDQYTPAIGRAVGVSTLKAMNELQFDRATFGLAEMGEEQSESESETTDDDPDGPPADASGPRSNAERITTYLREHGPTVKQDVAVAFISDGPMTSEQFNTAIEKAKNRGDVVEADNELRPQ